MFKWSSQFARTIKIPDLISTLSCYSSTLVWYYLIIRLCNVHVCHYDDHQSGGDLVCRSIAQIWLRVVPLIYIIATNFLWWFWSAILSRQFSTVTSECDIILSIKTNELHSTIFGQLTLLSSLISRKPFRRELPACTVYANYLYPGGKNPSNIMAAVFLE